MPPTVFFLFATSGVLSPFSVQRKRSNAVTKPSSNNIYRITVRKFSKRIAQAGCRRIAQASLDLQYANSTEHQWEAIAGAYLRGTSKMWGRSTALNRKVNFVTIEVLWADLSVKGKIFAIS